MTDGTNPPSNPQPEPAPGSGGFGPAPGGYGFPPAQPGGYGFPPPQPGQPGPPIPGGYGYPNQQPEPAPAAFVPAPQPDWEAMADRSEAQRSRRRMVFVSLGVVGALLAGGAGWFFFARSEGGGPDNDKPPVASGSPSPSQSAAEENAVTVPNEPTQLRDRANNGPAVQLAMNPGVELVKMENRNELRLKGGAESFAQGNEQAVDVTKSFTVTTRVYSVTETGTRMAISQGDGVSYSFELGFEVVSGKKSWVFRVQTGEKGAAATAQQVVVEAPEALKKWTQLTGTYDAEKKTIALYVNDKAAGQAQVSGIWAGPGPVQLGRARHHGIWSGSFVGSMDRIRVWDKALAPEQVAVLDSGNLSKLGKPKHAWLI
ncbi:LamG-like jellyroll fold domain-containing protein [Streptomyces sp. NPDC002467]|uniref:LamG-like jellyroll fold domain-containing protein n=1 Tax=Streptomyces sp. NPDC002467 TaxID=3364647 RepID=UPI0036CDEE1F